MTMISEIDHESSFNRLNGDPGLPTIPGGLEATHLVLEQESDGAGVCVALESEREVRLWTFRIVINHNLLVHVHTSLGQRLLLQSHGLR